MDQSTSGLPGGNNASVSFNAHAAHHFTNNNVLNNSKEKDSNVNTSREKAEGDKNL